MRIRIRTEFDQFILKLKYRYPVTSGPLLNRPETEAFKRISKICLFFLTPGPGAATHNGRLWSCLDTVQTQCWRSRSRGSCMIFTCRSQSSQESYGSGSDLKKFAHILE